VVQRSAQGRRNGPLFAVEVVWAQPRYFGAGVGTVVAGRAVLALLGTHLAGVKPGWARGAPAHSRAIIEFSLYTESACLDSNWTLIRAIGTLRTGVANRRRR